MPQEKLQQTLHIVRNTIEQIDKVTDLIEEVLDYLLVTDFMDITVERKDELTAKLHTVLIILTSMDTQLQNIFPEQNFSKVWIKNTHGILQFLEQLPYTGK